MLRTIAAIAIVAMLTACFADTASEGTISEGTGIDAAKTAAVQANIQDICAELPGDGTLSFCDELTAATNGGPDVAIATGGLLLIVGILASAGADAESICHNLAARHYDGDGKDLGYTHVTVVSGGNKVADCKIP